METLENLIKERKPALGERTIKTYKSTLLTLCSNVFPDVDHPFASIISSLILYVNGVFKFIASSREADIVRRRNIDKYIRLDFVGSFLL